VRVNGVGASKRNAVATDDGGATDGAHEWASFRAKMDVNVWCRRRQ